MWHSFPLGTVIAANDIHAWAALIHSQVQMGLDHIDVEKERIYCAAVNKWMVLHRGRAGVHRALPLLYNLFWVWSCFPVHVGVSHSRIY